ncbi:MAG TPA: hypothetical protein DHV36_17370 [Desulfobacteraceae bacterium]|nr:hypothetical protein [Desulfobacteraceae bacterium]
MESEISEQPSNIICLSEKRLKYSGCQHKAIVVDPDLEYVECRDCGERLNPMNALYRICTEESRFVHRIASYKKWYQKYKEKHRVKCRHCGKMTPVRVK